MSGIVQADVIQTAAGGPVSLTKQSAAKAWNNINQIGTQAVNGSFNVSSIADNGVGLTTTNFTSAFSDANYGISGTSSLNRRVQGQSTTRSANQATTAFSLLNTDAGTGASDSDMVCVTMHGTLA